MPEERGMAFIDFDNINITARRQHNIRYLDFNMLREILLKGLRHVGCIVYLPNKMSSMLPHIQKSGLEVKVVSPGKSVDGKLIFDLLTNAHKDSFDVAVIASGDRDYMSVVEEVKRKNKKVFIGSFSSALAHGMTSVSDGIINLDEHVLEISQKIYEHICTNCQKKFELPFKMYMGQAPLCGNCYKKGQSTNKTTLPSSTTLEDYTPK